MDARTAYQLFHLSYPKFRLVWIRLQVRRGDDWEHVLVGFVCGTFGDGGAGDVWDLPMSTLTDILNATYDEWEMMPYVDDALILAPPIISNLRPRSRYFYDAPENDVFHAAPEVYYNPDRHYVIKDAVVEHRENLARLFGRDSSENRKTKIFAGCAEVVGWYFDLRFSHWSVRPQQTKIEKIAHYLFNVIPVGTSVTTLKNMQRLAGLLCFYCISLPPP